MGLLLLFYCFALISCAHAVSTPFNLTYGSSRIVGGEDADITEFPYQVSIEENGFHRCGGAIIASNIILTAAHCFRYKPTAYTVRVGSSYVNRDGKVYHAADYVNYPVPRSYSFDGDIAVLWLSKKLVFNERVASIEMKEGSETEIPNNELAVVTGWGAIKEGSGIHEVLQKVTVPIIQNRWCNSAYNNSITPNMLCAGYYEGAKDACQSDSGGPLVHKNKLAGIVSWGYGCARPKYPGVYAKVSALRCWVDYTIEHLRLKHNSGTTKLSLMDLYVLFYFIYVSCPLYLGSCAFL